MEYKRNFTDLIEAVADEMSFTATIESVAVVGTNQVLTLSDMYYLQPGYTFTKATVTHIIDSIDAANKTITVAGLSPAITAGTFPVYAIHFFHGTILETTNTVSKPANVKDKTPMIWLLEQFDEKYLDDIASTIERETTCRIFFLTYANFEKVIDDRQLNYADPMRRLAEQFIAALRADKATFEMRGVDFTLKNWTKFGVYAINKGVVASTMMDHLAGVELEITLKIKPEQPC